MKHISEVLDELFARWKTELVDELKKLDEKPNEPTPPVEPAKQAVDDYRARLERALEILNNGGVRNGTEADE